jgi:hypothetical protein
MSNRPTFYLNDDKSKPIRAGGVIIYRINDESKMDILIVETKRSYGLVYEDFGGCTDKCDENYFETIVREVHEESNGLIKKPKTRERIMKCHDENYFYSVKTKYLLYIIPATNKQSKMISKEFGEIENHDCLKRTVLWIPLNVFLSKHSKIRHNFRLRDKILYNKLKLIQEEHKFSFNLLSSSSSNG